MIRSNGKDQISRSVSLFLKNFHRLIIQVLYLGLSARMLEGEDAIEVGLTVHDTQFSIDFCVHKVPVPLDPEGRAKKLIHHVIDKLVEFSAEHRVKFVGAGVGKPLYDLAPGICAALWRELDIVAMVYNVYLHEHGVTTPVLPTADEQSDSAVRKAIMHYGPYHLLRVPIGYRNLVEVDEGGIAKIVEDLKEYQNTVGETTWRCLLKYSKEIKDRKTKIAFFSSTPQGGGVGTTPLFFNFFLRHSFNASRSHSIVQTSRGRC